MRLSCFFIFTISAAICFCPTLSTFAQADNFPSHIRGYRVHKEPQTNSTRISLGNPEVSAVSLTGVSVGLAVELDGIDRSGKIDFVTFREFSVNDVPVTIEDYDEAFSVTKHQKIALKKKVNVFVSSVNILETVWNEIVESKPRWNVRGRVFVFGRFKRFGLTFKRVVPIDINIEIENPLGEEYKRLKRKLGK